MVGPLASDVRSVFSLPNPSTPTAGPSQLRRTHSTTERPRKPEGLPREIYSLIGPTAVPTLVAQFAKPRMKQKPNLGGGGRRVRWEWKSFGNSGRTDGLRLSHWDKAGPDPEADYPFAKYNIQSNVLTYSQDEYTRLLEDPHWTKDETDYLFQLVREFDGRFYIVHDRYEYPDGPARTLEDIKDRYFSVCRKLVRNRPWAGDDASKAQLLSSLTFDKDRETMRKKYVASLEQRTPVQIAEEEALYVELKRLEQTERKFKKDRDELLRTLLGIESGLPDITADEEGLNGGSAPYTETRRIRRKGGEPETPIASTPSSSTITLGQPVPKRQQSAKSAAYDAMHCIQRVDPPPNATTTTKTSHVPVYLRSYRLPAPKTAAAPRIAQVLGELGISHTRLVMPTKENCSQLESLIEAAAALVETKKVVDKIDQDLRVAKIRLTSRASEADEGETPGAMDVDEDGEGGEVDEEGRAQSVVSVRSARSARSRKQARRSMSISSVDTSTPGFGPKRKKRRGE